MFGKDSDHGKAFEEPLVIVFDFIVNKIYIMAGTVSEWSRALVRNHSEWMVSGSNPGKGCYWDGQLRGSRIAWFLHMAITLLKNPTTNESYNELYGNQT